MADVVPEQRRRACARVLSFDVDAHHYSSRVVANNVGTLLYNTFTIRDPAAFLNDYAQRVERGKDDGNYGDLDIDIVSFHRILGYGVDLGWECDLYDSAIARREDTDLPPYGDEESDAEEDEDGTQEQQEQQEEKSADNDDAEKARSSEKGDGDSEDDEDQAKSSDEDAQDPEDSDAGGSSSSNSPKSKQSNKRKTGGASNSRSKNREVADLERNSRVLAFSTRNHGFLVRNVGCPLESQLAKRSARLVLGQSAGSGSGGSGSGKGGGGNNNGRGTADLRHCDIVNTPMKIDNIQEYKASWGKDTQWLLQEVEKIGCLSSEEKNHIFIPFMSIYAMGILDEHDQHCGIKAVAAFFRPTSHSPRSESEDSALQSTIIKTPVFRFLVNSVVEVSV